MSRARRRIPNFRTEAAEAKFWDTHDTTDYLADLQEDTETVFLRPEARVIELAPAMWSELLAEAHRRRTTPQRLVQKWLKERLAPAARSGP